MPAPLDENYLHNGMVPIVLPQDAVNGMSRQAEGELHVTIDLDGQMLVVGNDPAIPFAIGAEQHPALLDGRDETTLILNARGGEIAASESAHRQARPWLFDEDVSA